MTARPQVELPELPHRAGTVLTLGDSRIEQVNAYTAGQMRDYAQQAIAESEARADRLATAIRNHQAQFPDQPLDGELELWAHVDAAIDAAQEAEREAGSA